METHIRNVGRILFYLGISMGVVSIAVLVASGGFNGLLLMNDPFYKRKDLASIPLSRVLALLAIVYSMLMAAPLAVAGRGILNWRPWSRTLAMLLSAVNLVFFPIGTALGIYAIWVLSDEASEFLFANAPAGGAKR